MRVVRASRDNRTGTSLPGLYVGRVFRLGKCGLLCFLGCGTGSRTGSRGQRSLGLATICSGNPVSRGARANSRHKLDKLGRGFSGCEVHLEAAIGLARSTLVVEAQREGASLPVKSQGVLDEGKGTESQPKNRNTLLLTVGPESAAPVATCLDQLRTIVSPYSPEKYAACRITGHEQQRCVLRRRIRVGPPPSRLLPRSCSTRRAT